MSTFRKKGAASEQLNHPCGISVSSDQFVYVCENKCVSVFKTSGEFVTSFGQFIDPRGIAVDDDGFVYVSDWQSLYHLTTGKVYIM